MVTVTTITRRIDELGRSPCARPLRLWRAKVIEARPILRGRFSMLAQRVRREPKGRKRASRQPRHRGICVSRNRLNLPEFAGQVAACCTRSATPRSGCRRISKRLRRLARSAFVARARRSTRIQFEGNRFQAARTPIRHGPAARRQAHAHGPKR